MQGDTLVAQYARLNEKKQGPDFPGIPAFFLYLAVAAEQQLSALASFTC